MRAHFGLFVDVRDGEWMLTNQNRDSATSAKAEEFCISAADPYLGSAEALDDAGVGAAPRTAGPADPVCSRRQCSLCLTSWSRRTHCPLSAQQVGE